MSTASIAVRTTAVAGRVVRELVAFLSSFPHWKTC